MAVGSEVWRTAVTLVGVPFRLHGHDPATGLDCVGLVAAAHRGLGYDSAAIPAGYRMRDCDAGQVAAWLAETELGQVAGAAAVGDVLLCAMGYRQMHLAIDGVGHCVHAHAGLRKVVLMPGEPGTVVGRWRWRNVADRGNSRRGD